MTSKYKQKQSEWTAKVVNAIQFTDENKEQALIWIRDVLKNDRKTWVETDYGNDGLLAIRFFNYKEQSTQYLNFGDYFIMLDLWGFLVMTKEEFEDTYELMPPEFFIKQSLNLKYPKA